LNSFKRSFAAGDTFLVSIEREKMDQNGIVGLMTTTSNHEEATRIASEMVQSRLVACAQIDGPVESHFFWQGEAQKSTEWRLIAKTTRKMIGPLTRWLAEAHSYDEPEILFFDFTAGSDGYVRWVQEEVSAWRAP
jgi:periplasmic divalent cation tolerance protein